jgi:hypothetical protein
MYAKRRFKDQWAMPTLRDLMSEIFLETFFGELVD